MALTWNVPHANHSLMVTIFGRPMIDHQTVLRVTLGGRRFPDNALANDAELLANPAVVRIPKLECRPDILRFEASCIPWANAPEVFNGGLS